MFVHRKQWDIWELPVGNVLQKIDIVIGRNAVLANGMAKIVNHDLGAMISAIHILGTK